MGAFFMLKAHAVCLIFISAAETRGVRLTSTPSTLLKKDFPLLWFVFQRAQGQSARLLGIC